MFVVLDTNHFAEMVHQTVLGDSLEKRLSKSGAEVFTTIITAQEVNEGWCAFIRKQKAGSQKQIHGYQQFQHSLELLMELTVLPFDEQAAEIFRSLRKALPRAGTQDLKIAAICIAHDATVLTRNQIDFQEVPDLRIENWLD
ncbi:MAG TPA: type II toxin-antitoxin system VapC family toxin [Prosthecobacter sp.]|nr:type II toxin-antitoxin system VapC family toxin [Prosthecobacter sp.]